MTIMITCQRLKYLKLYANQEGFTYKYFSAKCCILYTAESVSKLFENAGSGSAGAVSKYRLC
jgi:hypothetical protein